MWVSFRYDASTPQMNFRPGDDVEVPDEVVRRWEIIWELFVLIGQEMGDWKARGWRPETKALPAPVRHAAWSGVLYDNPVADIRTRRR